MYEGKIQQCDTPANVKASLGVQRLVYLPVMQLDQAETILKHNADLGRWFRCATLRGPSGCAHSAAQTDNWGNPAHSRAKLFKPLRYPNSREHLCGSLREIKGDSSEVNYPGFTEQPDGTAIGAQNLSKVFGNFRAVNQINLDIKYGEVFGLWDERCR